MDHHEGRATCRKVLFQPAALLRSPCRASEAGFTMLSAMAFHSDSSSFPDFSFLEAPLSITVPSCSFQTIETVIEIISNDRSEYVYSIKYF